MLVKETYQTRAPYTLKEFQLTSFGYFYVWQLYEICI